jgi:DNA recombination protein RmuC
VKTRGVWGETQLEAILEQLLTKTQYEKNVCVKPGSGESVEFAIKLPARNGENAVLLPIDAKLPLDIYQKLINAQEMADLELIEQFTKEMESAVKRQAKSVATKYIEPPITTDFAILFVPIEGLYAEILRITGLMEAVQQEYKVIITGPTTFSAILNTLQIGYRAVAIQQRSSEVWNMLTLVRKEFVKFVDLLSKTKIKLDQASKTIGDAEIKTRKIQKHLKNIEFESDKSFLDNNSEL